MGAPGPGRAVGAEFDAEFRGRLLELLRWRRDVRRFRPAAVPEAVLERVLQTAALAPSVGLSEPWPFVRVDDLARRAAVRAGFEACNARALAALEGAEAQAYARLKLSGMDEAPCHLAVFVEPAPAQGRGLGRTTMPETTTWSAVMAVHTVWLAARAEGLGLGWVSILEPAAVAAALDVPATWGFIGYLCLGYPAAESEKPALEQCGWERRRPLVVLRR